MVRAYVPSPIGTLLVTASGDLLTGLTIGAKAGAGDGSDDTPLLREAAAQLRAWFAGERIAFTLPLAPPRTPRGPAHRAAIEAIGYGDCASYGELARRLGSSPRAVGQACARNPLPIIVPCHRVLGAKGAIGHYSGGEGVATKRWLLAHEAQFSRKKGR